MYTKFKHLIVSGCSFTHNNHASPCVWANTLATWTGMTIDNLAIPGAGNTHIKNSIVLHLEKTRPDPADTLILIMWTGPERIDWITDRSLSNFKQVYPFDYQYTDKAELVLGGSWWANKNKDHVNSTLRQYSKYQSHSSLSLQSWIQIQDCKNYLEYNNYEYYFMSWFDYKDPVDQKNRWIDFDYELEKLGLNRPLDRWLINNVENSLGRWGQNHPEFLTEDAFHIGWQGHEAWLNSVLIPELAQKNILHENTSQ